MAYSSKTKFMRIYLCMVVTLRWLLMTQFFHKFLWMIFCVPEIFIVGDFFTELTQLKFPSLPNLTLLRTVVIIFLWWSLLRWLFLLVVISITACLCLQQQYKERNQDSTHYALVEFIWGSHFCWRSGRLTCLCKALNTFVWRQAVSLYVFCFIRWSPRVSRVFERWA